MNASEFLKYYRNPALLREDTLPALRQVVYWLSLVQRGVDALPEKSEEPRGSGL